MNEYIPKPLRERVAVQARHRCGYCLTSEAIVGIPMEIDHIVPRSLGGLTEEDNLWLACSLCNEHKGIRTVALEPAYRRNGTAVQPTPSGLARAFRVDSRGRPHHWLDSDWTRNSRCAKSESAIARQGTSSMGSGGLAPAERLVQAKSVESDLR